MEISTKINSQYTLFKISGRVDIENAHKLSRALKHSRGAALIIVDVSEVEVISSSGMGAFMSLRQQQERHDGKLVLLNPSHVFNLVLDILELRQYFTTADTLDEALGCVPSSL